MYHEITMKSSLREVYAHPVGHDILKKILLQVCRISYLPAG